MPWLTSFLTGLIAAVVRPIIREEINELKSYLYTHHLRVQDYKKYDEEAIKYIESMAKASTTEERYAILQKIKSSRPKLNF